MGLFTSINTASTGLTAQRNRLDVISDNIANATTTRTTDGGPFRRSRVILRPRDDLPRFKLPFLPDSFKPGPGTGVRVIKLKRTRPRPLGSRSGSPGRG